MCAENFLLSENVRVFVLELNRSVNLTSISEKVIGQLLDFISKQVEEVIRSSQCGFSKMKECLTNPVAFYDEKTG